MRKEERRREEKRRGENEGRSESIEGAQESIDWILFLGSLMDGWMDVDMFGNILMTFEAFYRHP